MIALAQSGGTGFYSGKVAKDTNGEFYLAGTRNSRDRI